MSTFVVDNGALRAVRQWMLLRSDCFSCSKYLTFSRRLLKKESESLPIFFVNIKGNIARSDVYRVFS